MKSQQSRILRYILILFLVFALARFFPVLMRLGQAAASGVREFWWALIPVSVISWVVWKIIRRRSIEKKSGYQFENQGFRDVTNSAEGPSEKK